MLGEILTLNLWSFFLVFARVGMAVSLMPGISAAYVNGFARLGLALLLSLLLTPALESLLPPMPSSVSMLVLLMGTEALIGLFFGLVARVIVAALQAAGGFIALVSSLANAMIIDPIAEAQSSIVTGFLTVLGLVIVFATDSHHLMIRALAETYGVFQPGAAVPVGDMTDYLAHRTSESFELGIRMAAPLALTALTYYIGLGILGRLMPALPVFYFGLPVQIAIQIVVMALTLSTTMMLFTETFRNSMTGFFGQ